MNEIGCVILDWKRPHNMKKVIASIKRQTIDTDIYVFHQGNNRQYDNVTENINLETNHGAELKYQTFPMLPNKYIINVDDDIQITDRRLFEKMLKLAKKYGCLVSIVGLNLTWRNSNKPYTSGIKVENPPTSMPCDIAVGMTTCCERLKAIEYYPYEITNERQDDEDIILSWAFLQHTEHNYIVHSKKCRETLDMSHGQAHSQKHNFYRNKMVKRLWQKHFVNVFAFDRDRTVEVNNGPVPLQKIKELNQKEENRVVATGNQTLKKEANIPGTIETAKWLDEDPSGWGRRQRVRRLEKLYPNARRYVVVDDADLSDLEQHGWEYYTPEEFHKGFCK